MEEKKEFNPHNLVTLRSSASYQIEFLYDGQKTFMPPLGRIKDVDKSLLGPLPKAIRIVKQ